jgi:hypothetical protein
VIISSMWSQSSAGSPLREATTLHMLPRQRSSLVCAIVTPVTCRRTCESALQSVAPIASPSIIQFAPSIEVIRRVIDPCAEAGATESTAASASSRAASRGRDIAEVLI